MGFTNRALGEAGGSSLTRHQERHTRNTHTLHTHTLHAHTLHTHTLHRISRPQETADPNLTSSFVLSLALLTHLREFYSSGDSKEVYKREFISVLGELSL